MQPETFSGLISPEAGQVIPNPLGGRMVVKLRDADTSGTYSVHGNVIPAGSPGPRPHLHHHHDETFFVLEGTLSVRIGPRLVTAPPGSFVLIPRGVVHQPLNPSAEPVRVLLIFSPGGMDQFFVEAAAGRLPLQGTTDDPVVLAKLAEFSVRYGFAFAELPDAPPPTSE